MEVPAQTLRGALREYCAVSVGEVALASAVRSREKETRMAQEARKKEAPWEEGERKSTQLDD